MSDHFRCRTFSSRMTGGSPLGADRFAPSQPEITAPVHTAGTAMVLRLASSVRFNARVLGRRPDELVFQVSAGRSQCTIVPWGRWKSRCWVEGLGGSGRGSFFLRPLEKGLRALAMMSAAHELQ